VKINLTTAGAVMVGVIALSTYLRSQTAPAKPAAITKVAILSMRDAMLATKEGQKAGQQLQATFQPRGAVLQKLGADIQAAEDQLRKGAATLSADAQRNLQLDIANKKKDLERKTQDLNTDAEEADNKMMENITSKMGAVIETYAKANGYTVVMDAQQPVLWASETANITPQIVSAYDQAHPLPAAAAPAPAKNPPPPAPAKNPPPPAPKK
jgi:outer membrane protein